LAKELGNIAEAAKKLGLPNIRSITGQILKRALSLCWRFLPKRRSASWSKKMNRSRRLTSSSSRPPLFSLRTISNKVEMVVKYREKIDVKALCLILGLSRSGFYAWLKRPKSKRDSENASLVEKNAEDPRREP